MLKKYNLEILSLIMFGMISVCVLLVFSRRQIVRGAEFGWGVLLMVLCFVAMQRSVIAIFGLGYKDLIQTAKAKIEGIRNR